MENTELLEQINKSQKKQLFHTRIRTALVGVILIVILLVCATIVPKTISTLDNVSTLAKGANETIAHANEALTNVDALYDGLSDSVENLNTAMEGIANIDFETLNQGITDLHDAVGPFASLMNKFK